MRRCYNAPMVSHSTRYGPAAALLALLLLPWSLRAEVIADIDVARIAVADRSERSLRDAQLAGLEEVVVKLTGTTASLQNETLVRALQTPARFLRGYSYVEEEDEALRLRLAYDGDALRKVLRDAGLPLWTANRPRVLAWLVWSDGASRRFASAEASPQLRDTLQAAFRRRGVPLQLPLYDLADVEVLSRGEAWRQSSAPLLAASARYSAETVLAGRVVRLSDGSWLGDWRFLDDQRWVSRPVTAPSAEAFVEAGAELVASTLSARYAVTGVASDDLRYRLRVSGVENYRAYVSLRRAVAALEAVERVVPESLTAEAVSLRIESPASQEQLARLIELDPRFERLAGSDGTLSYRWIEP